MDIRENSEMPDEADDALAKRLARLSQRPIDTSRLEPRVKAIVGAVPSPKRLREYITPYQAAAAGLLLVVAVIAVFVAMRSRPLLASPAELARIHANNAAGEPDAKSVDSIAAAGQVIRSGWAGCPNLPELSLGEVTSCHVHVMGRKRLSCLALQLDGQTVTMAVAHVTDMRLPDAPFVTRDGIHYFVQSHGNTNIVIADRNGVWLCLIASLPSERLVETAATLRFGPIREHG
jgi:hypothetical protein